MSLTTEQKAARSAKTKRWQEAHPEAARALERKVKLRSLYGISPEEYADHLIVQKGVCAICFQPETEIIRGKIRLLAVDHDHATGKVRGLLCQDCNLGLGRFNDDPELLGSAISYLRFHSA